MSDETNVEAGSETSGETTTDTTVTEQSATDTTVTDTNATDTVKTEPEATADAGGAADETKDESPKAGDACVCPDGRKGTIHSYDAGLLCVPNENQSE
jgi:hypothetical protein